MKVKEGIQMQKEEEKKPKQSTEKQAILSVSRTHEVMGI